MAPCGALCVPPCISDMDTLMETRECRAGPLTAAIHSPSPQTHHTHAAPGPRHHRAPGRAMSPATSLLFMLGRPLCGNHTLLDTCQYHHRCALSAARLTVVCYAQWCPVFSSKYLSTKDETVVIYYLWGTRRERPHTTEIERNWLVSAGGGSGARARWKTTMAATQ